jgi:hypothetical protein
MSYTPTQLGDNLNWDLVLRNTYERRLYSAETGVYAPIPDIAVTVDSPVIMVGTKSEAAHPHWFLGCWAATRLLVSPSSTSEFMAGVEVGRKACGLNRLTLLQFPFLQPMPYLLTLTPAYWLGSIFIEVWRYNGAITDDSLEVEIDLGSNPNP